MLYSDDANPAGLDCDWRTRIPRLDSHGCEYMTLDESLKRDKPVAKVLTGVVAMKDWNEQKQCWIGTVCQAFLYLDGTEGIVVYDVGHAETQVEIDDWGRNSIATKPWEKS